MKVVLFCGGLGTRLREHSDTIPKPLVNIGVRPIIWHLMRYYAHFGHKEFILCLGYRGELIREYFLHYVEALSNDFTMSEGGRRIDVHTSDIEDWKITFVDTGLHSNIGERLLAVRKYIENDPVFLANYSDGLSDLHLPSVVDVFEREKSIASLVGVRTPQSFHSIQVEDDSNLVESIGPVDTTGMWINGGYFVLSNRIFDYIEPGDELVEKPFQRLIAEKRLSVVRHQGFWQSMDTLKDKISFDRMYALGRAPWEIWNSDQCAPDSRPR
jgi:glucose-1-phosphate cytidylyltransferase